MYGTSYTVKELPTRVRIWTNYKFEGEPGKNVWIKSSPVVPRVTCKWSSTKEHSTKVDQDKMSSRSTRTRYKQREQVTLDLFPEVHTQRCYVSVEEGFKRQCSRTPMLLLPRVRSPLKPKVTYYGFLDEEWSLQTSCAAHNLDWAVTSTPSRLGAQDSKSNKLESTG